jgi:stage III sporulation protein AF
MTEILRNWVFGVVGAAFITAITQVITPEGRAKCVVSVVCGFVMLLALTRPLKAFDYGGFRQSLARLSGEAAEFSAPLDEVNENITRGIIEERSAAYILDKGNAHGIDAMSVTVAAERGEDGYWYPGAVTIAAQADGAQKSALAYDIETGLGVPPGEIVWKD